MPLELTSAPSYRTAGGRRYRGNEERRQTFETVKVQEL